MGITLGAHEICWARPCRKRCFCQRPGTAEEAGHIRKSRRPHLGRVAVRVCLKRYKDGICDGIGVRMGDCPRRAAIRKALPSGVRPAHSAASSALSARPLLLNLNNRRVCPEPHCASERQSLDVSLCTVQACCRLNWSQQSATLDAGQGDTEGDRTPVHVGSASSENSCRLPSLCTMGWHACGRVCMQVMHENRNCLDAHFNADVQHAGQNISNAHKLNVLRAGCLQYVQPVLVGAGNESGNVGAKPLWR